MSLSVCDRACVHTHVCSDIFSLIATAGDENEVWEEVDEKRYPKTQEEPGGLPVRFSNFLPETNKMHMVRTDSQWSFYTFSLEAIIIIALEFRQKDEYVRGTLNFNTLVLLLLLLLLLIETGSERTQEGAVWKSEGERKFLRNSETQTLGWHVRSLLPPVHITVLLYAGFEAKVFMTVQL